MGWFLPYSFSNGSAAPNFTLHRDRCPDGCDVWRDEAFSSWRGPIWSDLRRGETELQHQCVGWHSMDQSAGILLISRGTSAELHSVSGASDQDCSGDGDCLQWVIAQIWGEMQSMPRVTLLRSVLLWERGVRIGITNRFHWWERKFRCTFDFFNEHLRCF